MAREFYGELGLTGELKPVRGLLLAAAPCTARPRNRRRGAPITRVRLRLSAWQPDAANLSKTISERPELPRNIAAQIAHLVWTVRVGFAQGFRHLILKSLNTAASRAYDVSRLTTYFRCPLDCSKSRASTRGSSFSLRSRSSCVRCSNYTDLAFGLEQLIGVLLTLVGPLVQAMRRHPPEALRHLRHGVIAKS